MVYKDYEEKTSKILMDLDIKIPPISIEEVVASMGIQIKPFDFGDDVSGALLIDKEKSVIGYNPFEPPVRQRFTIAHELGHYILHSKKAKSKLFVDKKILSRNQVTEKEILYRNQDSSTGQVKQEREANNFAAAILMPAFMIYEEVKRKELKFIDEISIKELADTFNVSQQAMTIRLTNLDMLW